MSAVRISSSLLRSRAPHLGQLKDMDTWEPNQALVLSCPCWARRLGQSLQAAADRWPHREALVFLQDGVRKTFSQFQEDVDQAAAGLLALGLKRGDRLGVWGPNTYHWILFQFATAKAGIILVQCKAVVCPTQFKTQRFCSVQCKAVVCPTQFKTQRFCSVQCKAVVCPTQFKTQRFCDMLRQICPEMDTAESGVFRSSRLPDLCMVIVSDSRQTGTVHVEDVMQAGSRQHHQELQDLQTKLSFDDPINIQFTSVGNNRKS
ncbi:unnamed protein product [Coregonus sp. 'balchen']|nr:unnamed protein product [Coregonus sp. 'balchen']